MSDWTVLSNGTRPDQDSLPSEVRSCAAFTVGGWQVKPPETFGKSDMTSREVWEALGFYPMKKGDEVTPEQLLERIAEMRRDLAERRRVAAEKARSAYARAEWRELGRGILYTLSGVRLYHRVIDVLDKRSRRLEDEHRRQELRVEAILGNTTRLDDLGEKVTELQESLQPGAIAALQEEIEDLRAVQRRIETRMQGFPVVTAEPCLSAPSTPYTPFATPIVPL